MKLAIIPIKLIHDTLSNLSKTHFGSFGKRIIISRFRKSLLKYINNIDNYDAHFICNFIQFLYTASKLNLFTSDDKLNLNYQEPSLSDNSISCSLSISTDYDINNLLSITLKPSIDQYRDDGSIDIEWVITKIYSDSKNEIVQRYTREVEVISSQQIKVVSASDILYNSTYNLLYFNYIKCIEMIAAQMRRKYIK